MRHLPSPASRDLSLVSPSFHWRDGLGTRGNLLSWFPSPGHYAACYLWLLAWKLRRLARFQLIVSFLSHAFSQARASVHGLFDTLISHNSRVASFTQVYSGCVDLGVRWFLKLTNLVFAVLSSAICLYPWEWTVSYYFCDYCFCSSLHSSSASRLNALWSPIDVCSSQWCLSSHCSTAQGPWSWCLK